MVDSIRSGSVEIPEWEWKKLLTLISDGRVIPIIGPELLEIPGENKCLERLYDKWGVALAEQNGIQSMPEYSDIPLLYWATNQLGMNQHIQPGDLEYELDHVIRGRSWPIPESLRLLAEISDFPLYVTTTIDHLMISALQQFRRMKKAPLQVLFNRGGNEASCDLPRDFIPGDHPTVFHLFGATSTDPDGFAATEDALIEYSWALLDQQYAPKRFFDFLKRKMILLLGCDFPDWLGRFFVHALTREQSSQIAILYVSDCKPCGLHDFLRRKRARLFVPYSPVKFIEELHRRWLEQMKTQNGETKQEQPPSISKRGAVFISYAKEDRDSAFSIRTQLEMENIDAWMDESELESGMDFEYIIKDNIERASFFVPIISRAHDIKNTNRLGRFVLGEWHWAEKVNERRLKDDCYLRPVVVDDTPPGADFIERPFRDLHWTQFQNEKLPPEFIDSLRRGIRRYRSSAGGSLP